MYGAAVLDACEQIKARMEPVASKLSVSSFAEVTLVASRKHSLHFDESNSLLILTVM